MLSEALVFLVMWFAVFLITEILCTLIFWLSGERDFYAGLRALKLSAAWATALTAIGVVIRLAILALQHIPSHLH